MSRLRQLSSGLWVPSLAVPSSGSFDPTSLPFSTYFRTNFAGDPWVGTASAGLSGGRTLIDGVSPGLGAALNGRIPADYGPAPANKFQTSALSLADMVTGPAGSVLFLYKARTAAAASGNAYTDACFLSMVFRGELAVAVNATGIRAGGVDASAANVDVTKATATNVWTLGHCRWSSTLLEVGANGVWAAGVALGGGGMTDANYAGTAPQVGCDFISTVFLDGLIAEFGTAKVRFSDSQVNGFKSYANATYALAL